jgi:hypothetical protein
MAESPAIAGFSYSGYQCWLPIPPPCGRGGARGAAAGAPIALSQKEFAPVRALASEPTRVFAKDALLTGHRQVCCLNRPDNAAPRSATRAPSRVACDPLCRVRAWPFRSPSCAP